MSERAMTVYLGKYRNLRHYVHPVTGQALPGVTTVLEALDKPGLDNWKVTTTAEYAVKNRHLLVQLDEPAALQMVQGASNRQANSAADKGTDVHSILEDLANGVAVVRTPQNGWVIDTWEALNREFDVQVLEIEPTFWNPGIQRNPETGELELGYAGSADLLALVDGVLTVLDWKTMGSGIYGEVALQTCGYGMAPYILRPDGTEIDVRATYGEVQQTMAVWLRPEDNGPVYVGKAGWSLIPLIYDELTWLSFRAVRIAWEWQNVWSEDAVGKPLNKTNIGTKRAKARKAVA